MAFGQELKDFVSGFKTGYDLIDSKEEREEKRAKRKREQEAHDRTGKWGDEDRAFRRESFDTSNQHWEKQFEMDGKRFDFAQREAGRSQGNADRAYEHERDKLKLGIARETGETNRFQDYNPGGGGAIPEESYAPSDKEASNGGGSFQLASYSPDSAAQTANATSGFNLETYLPSIKSAESSGRVDAANPNSSAVGLYQPLKGTWANVARKYPELGLTPDGRTDPNQQERFIRRFTYDNGKELQRAGIPVTNGTMYAAHFLGSAGAKKVLRADPNASVASLVGDKVANANPFLKGMTVSDFEGWAERKGNGRKRKRPQAISAAVGGMVTALPDDEEDEPNLLIPDDAVMDTEPAAEETRVADAQGAIPVPGNKPQYDGVMEGNEEAPTDDPFELGRRGVRDGMKYSIKQSGMDKDSAIADPELEKMRQNYLKGYGAAPAQMMRQAIDKVDPERKMSTSERNMKAIGTVYQFYMDQGEVEKAQAAAGSMVQYYRQASSKFLALAQAAAAKGDIDNAAKAAIAGYANIPNGRDMQVVKNEDGTYTVSVTDEKTGSTVNKTVVTPQEFAAAAMNFNPGTFDDEILNAAGAPAEKTERDNSSEARTNIEMGIKAAASEIPALMELNPARQSAIRGIAANIMSAKDNDTGPEGALEFAMKLAEFDGTDLSNDKANFSVKPIRGDTKNSNVTVDGLTYKVSNGQLSRLGLLRNTMSGERKEQQSKNEKDAASSKALAEKVKRFGQVLSGQSDENSPGAIAGRLGGEALKGITPPPSQDETMAIPDGGAAPSQADDNVPLSTQPGLPPRIKDLLETRENILGMSNPSKYQTRLDEVEDELRQLGVMQ